MKLKSLWFAVFFILLFTGIWFKLAASLATFMEEPEYLCAGKGIALTGSNTSFWDFDQARIIKVDKKALRGTMVYYLCSWAFKIHGDPILLARLIMLAFTILTYLIVLFYYHQRKILTPQLLVIWTVLFFGSFTVLYHSLYIRYYALLTTVMTAVFILYWEGLMAYIRKDLNKALILWLIGLALFAVPLLDMWQYQQLPMMVLAIVLSASFLFKHFRPVIDWIKKKEIWIWSLIIVMGPVMTVGLNAIPIPLNGVYLVHWFSTYWDNIIGFLRFVVTLNVVLLGLRYAADSTRPLSFDSWMFMTGLLSGIFCTLYNPSNPVFYPKYSYLPAVMVLIGFSGFMQEAFASASVRRKLLAVYLSMNILMSWAHFYAEHSNIKTAIRWLNTNLAPKDVLIEFDTLLALNAGEPLMPIVYHVKDQQDMKSVQDLKDYIKAHPRARIFYLYNDEYAFRDRLYELTTGGGDRYPGQDLWSYLKDDISSTPVLSGLRNCGLVEFNHAALLKGLYRLSQKGFEAPWKAPEKVWLKHWGAKLFKV